MLSAVCFVSRTGIGSAQGVASPLRGGVLFGSTGQQKRTGALLCSQLTRTGIGSAQGVATSFAWRGVAPSCGCAAGTQNVGEPPPRSGGGSIRCVRGAKKNRSTVVLLFFFGDPYGNRTHVTAVKGPCLNRWTNGPYERLSAGTRRIILVAGIGLEPMTYRV